MKKIIIGNGGAGLVRFVQYMYTEFNTYNGTNYDFEWKLSDTNETLDSLSKDTSLDMGWPYGIERVSEAYQKMTEKWTKPGYIFRDHFALVGPKTNCADLPILEGAHPLASKEQVYSMFKKISGGQNGTKFLTRNDGSATNFLEREIFNDKNVLDRFPDVNKDSSWYIPVSSNNHYPGTSLEITNNNGYYTLTDRGFWIAAELSIKNNLQVFCEGGDAEPDDILLNPCLAIALKNSCPEVEDFYKWLTDEGQECIESYKLNGERLYSKAPGKNIFPC